MLGWSGHGGRFIFLTAIVVVARKLICNLLSALDRYGRGESPVLLQESEAWQRFQALQYLLQTERWQARSASLRSLYFAMAIRKNQLIKWSRQLLPE